MCSQNAGNAISKTQILKVPAGACPQTTLANSCLWHSACTFGDRMHTILGGGQGKWALWQFCPTSEESLKLMHCAVRALSRAFFNYITGGAKAPPAPMVAPPLNYFGPPSQSPFSLKYKQNMEFRREV
jgi:hypothetical protein